MLHHAQPTLHAIVNLTPDDLLAQTDASDAVQAQGHSQG